MKQGLSFLIVLVSILFSQSEIEFYITDLDESSQTFNLMVSTNQSIQMFNLNFSGIEINSISGGVLDEYNYSVNLNNQSIAGWPMSMDQIPAGDHLFTTIEFSTPSDIICIYNGSCNGWDNGDTELGTESCMSINESADLIYFNNVLNGYESEYINYDIETGEGIVGFITIELTDGDFGDEIGVMDYNGGSGYGDCEEQFGNVLVGASMWSGHAVTIPVYGFIDECLDGGFQLPGFIMGNPIAIHVWDASEGIEYIMNIIIRDELFYEDGFIIINELEKSYILGDINQDNAVDILDIVLVVNIILEILEPTDDELNYSDLNSDGEIDIIDIILIINLIL
ncbi:MAG: hypothetical protein H8E72_06595 [Candidatus Marinimicrobia bacterium]|nr:hypothetical protein [Candidatus Neomarinimicrobiota bacterium]